MKESAIKNYHQDNQPDWLAEGYEHIWLPYTQMQNASLPLSVIDAYGSKIKLADGKELIDGFCSWWSACHGYKHPKIIAAIQKQAEELSHVMLGGLAHEQAYKLAKKLAEITPHGLEKVFFTDSGSTAVETAMKMAVQFWKNSGKEEKNRFISFKHSYHGDTMGAISLADPDEWIHSAMNNYGPEQICLDLPKDETGFKNFRNKIEEHESNITAVIIEPLVQCAGGFKIHSSEVLREIRNTCKEYEILFIADEVATGFGRTGKMFACEEAEITPDIMCIGKALTGGTVPMSAVIATSDVFKKFLGKSNRQAFMSGPTYMGNALACAAANASIELFAEEPRLEQVKMIETQIKESLEKCKNIDGVKDIRVKGAIGAIEIKDCNWKKISKMREEFIKQDVWIRPFDDVAYIMPAFTIQEEELEILCNSLFEVISELS